MTVASSDSLTISMDKAVKHYSSLFKLPPYGKMVLLLALLCISSGVLSAIILFPSLYGLIVGILLGVSLLLTNIVLDHAISALILKGDPIYDLRRTTGLSLFSWVFWLFFIFIGTVLTVWFGSIWWVRLCLLGFSAVLIFRLTVLNATSFKNYSKLLAASFLQPIPCVLQLMIIWTEIDYLLFLFLVFASVVSIISSWLFLSPLNRVGKKTLKVPSLSLLKAFLLNWVVDLNAPFESFLEQLGEEQNVEVSLIKFDSAKPKAVIAVPSIHPGPFKNIGSSPLPSMLKTSLENTLNCVACVPHGLLGHEFDLASQSQNQKVISHIIDSVNFEGSEARATPFVKVSNGIATACCQIFGKSAFISFSLAPRTTEDFPQELGYFVSQEAERRGITCYTVVNAHNSIDGNADTEDVLSSLKAVAIECLKKAVSLKQLPFEVGVANVQPRELSLKDGMGPGGITAIVVKVGDQKTAYVVIDGNNMVTSLREKILSALSSLGINDGEIFTTDTHLVNAIVLVERGYHPIGEAIDHEKLIEYIKESIVTATSNLERVKVACRKVEIHNVKVIGEKALETLCLLIDRAKRRAKRIVAPIFVSSGIILMLFLVFFIS
ncbi:MAG: DUF2070 family protein [Candidatus Bathyarchaeota archaeon]|jgi:putative membrane protein|nr:DUF2070 family protein [Candidatus Bathyarchaeota archaeon]